MTSGMQKGATMTRAREGSPTAPGLRARPQSPPALSARRTAVLLAALLAFVRQGFVTQTHEHFAIAAASTLQSTKALGGAEIRTGQPLPDQPANCPICQDIAHAGAYIAPTPPIAFYATAAATLSPVAPPSLAFTVRERSHAWRSRAPPAQLQA